MIRKLLIFIFTCLFFTSNAQKVFKYEKEITNKEKYNFHEITFENLKEDIQLSGTLITPKIDFKKVVIIVPGSGLDTRHSHYKLTQALLDKNIAVYRYDERGVGKSEGDNSPVNYGISKITNDLLFSIRALRNDKSVMNKSLGLIGHSQGGMATIGALQQNENVDFLVQWAAPVQKNGEFLKYQMRTGVNRFDDELIYDDLNKKIEIFTVAQKVVRKNVNDDDLTLSKKIKKETKKHGFKRSNYTRFPLWTFPSMKDLLRQDYESTYKNAKIPILYIIGAEDNFVDPKANSELLASFNNPHIKVEVLKNLNHYLTEEKIDHSALEMSSSYYKIDDVALNEIIQFIEAN
ncbi:alpha/beta hydrolase [Joostella atrarenae]|uniref:Alpha/beta hydrolase n=1 Tax=Joostella atrarenae TaxID=679257 RepID=A0ABS9J115_9FLAO|nr:alpha/beta hydrolase [Joostella atrarenae]MCF8714124.1 alpha/beta hydrolase [Joostella atrarenae]